MGFWPFGSGKKKQAPETRHTRDRSDYSDPSENMGRLEKASTDLSANTRPSTRLVNNRVASQDSRSQTVPATPEKPIYSQNPTSQSSLGPENFSVLRQPPTLHARKADHDANLARRKSSKRKAEDYAREREIRAMSSSPIPIPRRPASFYGGSFQRDVRDVPVGPSRRLNRPGSQVSLPIADALPNPDEAPYQNSYKIGMFAALSPRPTVKYDSRQSRGKQPAARPNPIDNPAIVEEDGVDLDKKRIDALADDLDSGGLRELMERDKRRRERKSKDDAAKLKRRLQRAEKQKEEEARKERTAEYVSQSRSRVRSIQQEKDAETGEPSSNMYNKQTKDPFADPQAIAISIDQQPKPASHSSAIRNPFADDTEGEDQVMEDVQHQGEPPIPVRSPLRQIQQVNDVQLETKGRPAAFSPPISPEPLTAERQSMSQASVLNRENADPAEAGSVTGAASDHSSQRLSNWTAFFRRGTRRKLSSSFQDRSTPSEFSNTSRESFVAARKSQPPPAIPTRSFRRADSTPQRATSKFREDLPEFPTPPASRMQSPEVPSRPQTYNQIVTANDQVAPQDTDLFTGSATSPIPMPGGRDEERYEPASIKPEMILSQSLASVDSEASWLSGKPIHRRSGASQRMQGSRSSLGRPLPGLMDAAATLPSPEPEAKEADRGELRTGETLHAGAAQQPRLIRQASRAKSKEGLLADYAPHRKVSEADTVDTQGTAEDSEDPEDPESPLQPEPEVTLMRARSVGYKGHARHISAGSAKLLDIRKSFTPSEEMLAQPKRASTSGLESHLRENASDV